MKKFIKLHHHLYKDERSFCPILINIDNIRTVTSSETGSIVWLDNGDYIHATEKIIEIESLLNTKKDNYTKNRLFRRLL